MDLEVGGTEATKRQMSSLCSSCSHYVSGIAAAPLIVEVTPHPMSASHLIQECWLPRKRSVQVVFLAFIYLFLYDESYSEWSSFCSAVVHNSRKKTDFSSVNFKGLRSGIYTWKDLLRKEFLFFIYTTRNSGYL